MSEQQTIDLAIEGMTCAACATRIQKVLDRQRGVTSAAVNFAMERARVRLGDEGISVDSLVAAVQRAGYGARPAAHAEHMVSGHDAHLHDDRSARSWLRRFAVAAILTAPIVAVAMTPSLAHRPSVMWIAWVLATPVQFWAGWPFLVSAARRARRLAANMDTLVAIGTLAAYSYSAWVTLVGRHDHYFETGAVVITLLALGKYFEAVTKGRAKQAITALLELAAKEARVLRDGVEVRVPVGELAIGDVFVARPGDKIATDGVVEAGDAAVDESMVTGEAMARDVAAGDTVVGGTINLNGSLTVRVRRVGDDTALARIVALVEEAQASKAPIQRLADRVAEIFVPIVLLLAAVTFAAWLVSGHAPGEALIPTVAVLIIACPCAMGLATPVAIMVGTGRASQLGVLIRGGEPLERSRSIDVVVLDKTGTLTQGRMGVTDVVVDHWNGASARTDEILSAAASVEGSSEHPIATAVTAAAKERGLDGSRASSFRAFGGRGAVADVDGRTVWVGRRAFLSAEGLISCAELDERARALELEGKTVFAVGWDRRVRGLIAVADTIKPTSKAAVRALHGMGLQVMLLTGDNEATARAVAETVGIDEVVAQVLPDDKAAVIARLQREGKRIAMVGDGINDGPALATADLGIAIGSGTDVAIEASDITLVGDHLLGVPTAIGMARRTFRTIRQNLFWAFGYNVVLLPLAAIGKVDPMLAGLAMAASSVSVVANALRLKRVRAVEG